MQNSPSRREKFSATFAVAWSATRQKLLWVEIKIAKLFLECSGSEHAELILPKLARQLHHRQPAEAVFSEYAAQPAKTELCKPLSLHQLVNLAG
jgi:hypothetical protein